MIMAPEMERPYSLDEEGGLAMDLLIAGKLGAAAREFIHFTGTTEEDLPLAIANLSRFAETMSSAGIELKRQGALQGAADRLQEAAYAYFFHGLLQEYLGRKRMDVKSIAAASVSYEFAGEIARLLDPKSYIFTGNRSKFCFRETMERRRIKLAQLYARKFEKRPA